MNVVIVNCFDTYEHRVDLLYSFFCNRGDSVHVYTSNFQHIEKKKINVFKKDFTYINAISYHKNISPKRLFSHYKLAKDLFKLLRGQPIDLLWVLVPPNSFVKEAAALKKQNGNMKLILDIIDMWPETMPIEKYKKFPLIKDWRLLRDNGLSFADHIVTECNLFRESLKKLACSKEITTLYLAKKVENFKGELKLSHNKLSLCYLGSINNIIDIPTINYILLKLKEIQQVELHIIGDGEKRNELIESCKTAGVDVIYHGKLYDQEKKQHIFDQCHFGLNIMKESVHVGLTMKSLDYFEAGLPIINNIKGDTWELVNIYNMGYNIENLCKIDLKDKEKRLNARRFFEDELSVESFNRKVEDILNQV